MYVIMGGTGHVGSAVAATLLGRGEKVAIITHDASRAVEWRRKGAEILEAEVNDAASLRSAFRHGRRAFLLNPPADVSTDTDSVERQTVASILSALDGSGLEKVVAASTGGAQRGNRIGDLSVLWELEQGLGRQKIPAAIHRGAYYMSNWDAQLQTVRDTHKLRTMFPADLAIPMVAPHDLGEFAAQRLVSGLEDVGMQHVEGPSRYSSADVARAISQVLGTRVDIDVIPRGKFREAFRGLGFSEIAAESYTRMTDVSLDSGFDMPEDAIRGTTTLEEYVHGLLAKSQGRAHDSN